jgi:hypothetical protein
MSDQTPGLFEEPVAEPAPETTEVETEVTEVEETAPETEEPTEPETWEVEKDGQKYVVPYALRDEIMWHMDYTEKTQKLAEERKQATETLQKQQEAFHQQTQSQRENLALYGELAHTEKLLDDFSKVDLLTLQREDPDQAQMLGFQREALRDKRDALESEIERREHESRVQMERAAADRKDRLEADLARDIPNYSPELRSEMEQTAIRHGFTEREIAAVGDARMMKMLHLAHLGEQVLKKQTATPKPKPVKPVQKVTGGKAPDMGPTDKQAIDGWMERRNEQLRRA